MIIVVKPDSPESDVREVIDFLDRNGLKIHLSEGVNRTIIGVIGDKSGMDSEVLGVMPAVEKIIPVMESYKLVGRSFKPDGSIVTVKDVQIGGKALAVMAGPCAVESESQIYKSAEIAGKAGARFLRGGAFKPRTSPYAFQGLEAEGLKMMRHAADEFGLLVTSEIVSENDMELASEYVDLLQIGARNAQNFRLLKAAGKAKIPVLLKRGIAQTIEEWLGSAEYIMSEGNYNIILCERGIRTFETATRNTLDLSAVPVLRLKTHLPIIVDPSHAAGRKDCILPLSKAAVAVGADGLIIEMHPNPKEALSDASQQLKPEELIELCKLIEQIAPILGREFSTSE